MAHGLLTKLIVLVLHNVGTISSAVTDLLNYCSEYIIDMMAAPGALIPAEVPSSQFQNYSFAVRGCAEIVGLPNNTHSMLDDGTGVLGISSDLGKVSALGRVQPEELLDISSPTKPDKIHHFEVNETEKFEHTEPSPAEKMRVNNVSKYVLSAAKNPEFAQKLHSVLLESGALPPPDLFSDMNPQDTGEDKVNEKIVVDAVQADPNGLLLSYEKCLMPSQGVGCANNTKLCQSADWLVEQQKELHTAPIGFFNSSQIDNTRKGFVTASDRVNDLELSNSLIVDSVAVNPHKMCKEKFIEPSAPKADVSCKGHDVMDCFCDDGENSLANKVEASFNNIELGKDSAIQVNETGNGDCILRDGKSKNVNPVLGEGAEWEIQWEDLSIGERIGIGKFIPLL